MSDQPPQRAKVPPNSVPVASSMTGQGAGRADSQLGMISVELRSVNHRGLRISTRMGDWLSPLEGRFEQLLRGQLGRGSVQASARFSPHGNATAELINTPVLLSYARQLQRIAQELGGEHRLELAALLQLPGAIASGDDGSRFDREAVWDLLRQATLQAVEKLAQMRRDEGAAMAAALATDAQQIAAQVDQISQRAAGVVQQYRQRLETRLRGLLQEQGLEASPADLLREVQLFADRCDISEEITRLQSHLRLFDEALRGSEAGGRKLEFIIQEMHRETNTIGSKASDAAIAAAVVEIKCAIERMRELVQNIE